VGDGECEDDFLYLLRSDDTDKLLVLLSLMGDGEDSLSCWLRSDLRIDLFFSFLRSFFMRVCIVGLLVLVAFLLLDRCGEYVFVWSFEDFRLLVGRLGEFV
jgi:hypothetical protein